MFWQSQRSLANEFWRVALFDLRLRRSSELDIRVDGQRNRAMWRLGMPEPPIRGGSSWCVGACRVHAGAREIERLLGGWLRRCRAFRAGQRASGAAARFRH